MFQRWLSLCVAILPKFFQQIAQGNKLSISIGQHNVNNFCNFEKAGFTPVLANHKKENFPLKRAFLGESQSIFKF